MKKKKTSKNKYLIPIIMGILTIIFICIGMFYMLKDDDSSYNEKLINQDYDYVFTYKEINTGRFTKQIPHINLDISSVNEEIDNFTANYLNKDDNIISYEYAVTNNILSVVVRIISFASNKAPINYFKSFNINLDTIEVISNKDLLSAFKATEEFVQEKIEEQFKDYYYDLVFKEEIDETKCNLECFIERRGFLGYMQDVNYYVDDGKLIVYKPFIINSSLWEYEYFKDEDFAFVIVG